MKRCTDYFLDDKQGKRLWYSNIKEVKKRTIRKKNNIQMIEKLNTLNIKEEKDKFLENN